jgi:hypothetical protein
MSNSYPISDPAFAEFAPEVSVSGVSWAAIFAGAVSASALSLILIFLGVGLGFSSVSPWENVGASASTIAISSVVWLAFTQIAASGLGGYLAGRLRGMWNSLHTDEVYFRDTAHGLLSWSIATLIAVVLAGAVIGNIASSAASAGSTVAAGAFTAAGVAGAAKATDKSGAESGSSTLSGIANYMNPQDASLAYTIEALFRKDIAATTTDATNATTATNPTNAESANTPTSGEVTRIFINAFKSKSLSPLDQRYLAQLISQRTGVSMQEADRRVVEAFNRTQAALVEAETNAKAAADKARKTAAYSALWLFAVLLAGAFVASWAATFGGKQRDFVGASRTTYPTARA